MASQKGYLTDNNNKHMIRDWCFLLFNAIIDCMALVIAHFILLGSLEKAAAFCKGVKQSDELKPSLVSCQRFQNLLLYLRAFFR